MHVAECGVVLVSQGEHLPLDLWKLGANLHSPHKKNAPREKAAANVKTLVCILEEPAAKSCRTNERMKLGVYAACFSRAR